MPRNPSKMVPVPADLLLIIERVFLPKNPNKLRAASPMVVEAVREFKALSGAHCTGRDVDSLSQWEKEAAALADALAR